MKPVTVCDHTRGLCGKPNVPNNTSREEVEKNPAHCLCCESEMRVEDTTSSGMGQLGMYWLICPICPAQEKQKEEIKLVLL